MSGDYESPAATIEKQDTPAVKFGNFLKILSKVRHFFLSGMKI
jgi:hypothetical protein